MAPSITHTLDAVARRDATEARMAEDNFRAHPIRLRSPTSFEALKADYESLIHCYLSRHDAKPLSCMSVIAHRIGDLGGGPQDIIELHIHGLEHVVQSDLETVARECAAQGRLLAMEMMGLLIDYYRAQSAAPHQTRAPQRRRSSEESP